MGCPVRRYARFWGVIVALLLTTARGVYAGTDDPLILVDQKYDRAVALYPSDPQVFLLRGNAWRELEQFERALADYNRALQLKHDFADALFNRGLTLRMQREYDRAIADYTYLIQLHPQDIYALNNRAIIWSLKGNFFQAFIDFDQALRIAPKDRLINKNRDLLKKHQSEYHAFRREGDLPELEESYARYNIDLERN